MLPKYYPSGMSMQRQTDLRLLSCRDSILVEYHNQKNLNPVRDDIEPLHGKCPTNNGQPSSRGALMHWALVSSYQHSIPPEYQCNAKPRNTINALYSFVNLCIYAPMLCFVNLCDTHFGISNGKTTLDRLVELLPDLRRWHG